MAVLEDRANVTVGQPGLGGQFAFYSVRGDAGNGSCSAASAAVSRMKPLVKGEVAAVELRTRPQPAPALAFTGPDGQPTTLATIDADGVLRAKGLGRVRAVATAGTLTARQELELTQQRVLNDPLDDWHLTSSHSSGLVFDTLNTQLFDGDLSRVKRNIDAPQQVVYHLADLTGFSARIYWEGELADKMTVAISRDGREWTGIEPARTPTEHSGGNFRASTLSADKLPAGTAYLRFTLANDTVVWSPQLAAVTLYAAR